jgi:tetratricopeptide (TPR) repeat protein
MNIEQNDLSNELPKSCDQIARSDADGVIVSNLNKNIIEQLTVKIREEGIPVFAPASRTSKYNHLANFDDLENVLDRLDIKGNKFAQAMDLIFNADCDINGGYHSSLGGLLDTVNINFGGLTEATLKQWFKELEDKKYHQRESEYDIWDAEAAHSLLVLFKLFENCQSLEEIFEEINQEFLRLSKQVKVTNPNRQDKSNSHRSCAYSKSWDRGQRRLLIDIINLEIDLEIGDRSKIARSLYELGVDYYELKNYRQAINYFQQSLEVYQELGEYSKIIDALHHLGLVYCALENYQQAINYYQQALKICREIKDCSRTTKVLDSLGLAYYALNNYHQAIEYYQQSLEIYEELGDFLGIARSLHHLGNAYSSLKEHQQAIEHYQQSLKIYREQEEEIFLQECYFFAIEHYQQSLEIYQKLNNRSLIAGYLQNLGPAYSKLEDYERAIEHYQQYLEIYRKLVDYCQTPTEDLIADLQRNLKCKADT